jgi:hypothetical protein
VDNANKVAGPIQDTRPRKAKKPRTAKQLATLHKHCYKPGISGNKQGISNARAQSFVEATNYARELASSPLAHDTITRLLRNKRNPRLQLAAWIAVWERAYGGVVQIATMEAKLSIDDKRVSGSAALPAPHAINPSDPQQLRRAIEVAKGLAVLAASFQPPVQAEPRDVTGNTLPEAVAALPPAPADHGKVIAVQRGPERFNGAGARLEVISDSEQEKFRQKPFRG